MQGSSPPQPGQSASPQTPLTPQDVSGAPEQCPACGATDFASFQPAAFKVPMYVCRGCRLHITRQPEVTDSKEADHVYEAGYHTAYEQKATKKTRTNSYRLRIVESKFAPGSFLDIGCSVGCFLQAAVRRGWEAWGVDLSRYAVETCRRQGLQAKVGDMQHLDFPDETFDMINLRHVLEHDWHLHDCLREIKRVLKISGILLVEVPSVDCWQVRLLKYRYAKFWSPAHYHYYWFSRRALQDAMRQAGFEHVPLPMYGRLALSGGPRASISFLGWRTHKLVRHWLGLSPHHVQAWRKL